MTKSSMRSLSEAALKQLEMDGASRRKLISHRYTEFGEIVRYCEQVGKSDFSEAVIDEYILNLRSNYENGTIPKWKWTKIRRGGELLKLYHATRTLEMPRCRPWEVLHNPLRRQPTVLEASDPNNIFGLVTRTKQELQKFGFAKLTLYNYELSFDRILRTYINHGTTHYSQELSNEIVSNMRKAYESGALNRIAFQMTRKVVALLEEQHKTNTLDWCRLLQFKSRKLSDAFAQLLDEFEIDYARCHNVKANTAKQYKKNTRRFLFELEDSGIFSMDAVTLAVVSEQITVMAQKYAGGLRTLLGSVRTFLGHLHTNGITAIDLSFAVPKFFAPHRKIYEGFTREEIDRLFTVLNTTTLAGKRDYSILTLAFQTGLRSCDIANLRRKDICWHKNEIKIIQAKTGVVLTLPLPIESGNAIADYLLHARPESDEPYIFLSMNSPFRSLKNSAIGAIVSRCMSRANIENDRTKRLGFHSFRRSFGKRLLESEIATPLLSELLGHTKIDSLSPYISIDESNLQNCALGLISCGKADSV